MNVQLEQAQEELLATLCEASRRQPPRERQEFIAITMDNGHFIQHPQLLPEGHLEDFHWGDLVMLADYGFLHIVNRGRYGEFTFDVGPTGFEAWRQAQGRRGEPVDRLEEHVKRFLDGREFRQGFILAFDKWAQAEALLWSEETPRQLTTIGHLCREAMQAFAGELATRLNVEVVGDPAKTVARLRACVAAGKKQLAEAHHQLLDALVSYWGAVSDLVQRQEHGAQKEGEALGWEDGRLVVFQTGVVMYELARSLGRR